MRIAVVSSGNIPSQLANSINTVRHADAFLNNGHEVKVFSVLRKKEMKFLKGINIYNHYNIQILPFDFIKDTTVYFYNNSSVLNKLFSILETIPLVKIFFNKSKKFAEKQISNTIFSQNYDLSYCRSYFATLHNIDLGINTILETHAAYPKKIPQMVELRKKINSKYFKGIVTIHFKIKKRLVDMGFPENKILVLEDAVQQNFNSQKIPPIEELKNKLELPPNKKIITYVGSLKKGKGIGKIIELSKKLKDRDDVIFHIVGGSQIEIKNIFTKYSPSTNVHFSGFVSGSEIPNYLACADLLLLLYDVNEKTPVMDFETTSPIKLFEYMSSGKPILATRLPTIEKIVDYKEDFLIYEKKDLSGQVNQIIDNLGDYQQYTQNTKELSNLYTYEKRSQEIISTLVD